MWIILGNKVQTALVPGGRRVERLCSACGETAMFYEREVSKSFRLYFVDLFNYETQRVMACGACGAHYATDELGRPLQEEAEPASRDPQRGTVLGAMRDALRRAGNAIQDATGQKSDPDVEAAKRAAEEQKQKGAPPKPTIQSEAKRLSTGYGAGDGDDDFVDPLSDDEDELTKRFKALEAKLRLEQAKQKK